MTVEETRLEQERLGTRPAPHVCQFNLCQVGKDHPAGHSWLDNPRANQYPAGYFERLQALAAQFAAPFTDLNFILTTEDGFELLTESDEYLEYEHA